MIRRVTRISPWQAGKFFAVLYFLIGIIFAVVFALIAQFTPADQAGFGLGFAVAFPFMYAIGALIFVPIACWIFNLVAKLVGGLEFEVVEQNPA
jgi:hypothetical protein